MRIRSRCFSILALAAVLAAGAYADDWLMYRKNAQRTASSNEKLSFPLKPAWTWTSSRVKTVSPLSTVAVKGDYSYFTTGLRKEPGSMQISDKRMLVCVENGTGKVKWSKELDTPRLHPYLSEDVGPVVSDKGIVFVVDHKTIYIPCATSTFTIKAFSAESGDFIQSQDMPVKNVMGRLFIAVDGERTVLLPPDGKPES